MWLLSQAFPDSPSPPRMRAARGLRLLASFPLPPLVLSQSRLLPFPTVCLRPSCAGDLRPVPFLCPSEPRTQNRNAESRVTRPPKGHPEKPRVSERKHDPGESGASEERGDSERMRPSGPAARLLRTGSKRVSGLGPCADRRRPKLSHTLTVPRDAWASGESEGRPFTIKTYGWDLGERKAPEAP